MNWNYSYLDPSQKDGNGHRIVKMLLPVREEIKVRILVLVIQKRLQFRSDGNGTIHIEYRADNADNDDDDIQPVPDGLEVAQLVFANLFE